MATLQLRTPDDVRRLFSALGDDLEAQLTHESGGLSLSQLDQMSLENAAGGMEAADTAALVLSLLVAITTSWSAIHGYKRNNNNSLQWGLAWGVLGALFPAPAIAYTAWMSLR